MENKVTKKEQKALVQWKGESVAITFNDVKTLLCPLATDQEIFVFLKTCQSLQLNPFANEIFLIKYSDHDKAAMVIAITSYLKAAESNNNYSGSEAGIILKQDAGNLIFREGAFILPEEFGMLVGGWAKVYRRDRDKPVYIAVNKSECIRYNKNGELTRFWDEEKQPSMLRKTALKRALVEAFPSLFTGTLANADIADETVNNDYNLAPENTLPQAYMKDDKNNWRKWWARQAEKGLYEDEIRGILEVESIKEDWIDKGRTLEEADKKLNEYLKKRNSVKGEVVEKPAQSNTPGQEIFPPEESKATDKSRVKQRKPEDITVFGELYQACRDDFDMKTRQEVWNALNVASQIEITDKPWDCYVKIKSARSK